MYVYEYFSGPIANDKHLADSLLQSCCFPFIQPQKPRSSHLSAIYPDRSRRSSDKSSSETERERGHRISLAQSVLKKINPAAGTGGDPHLKPATEQKTKLASSHVQLGLDRSIEETPDCLASIYPRALSASNFNIGTAASYAF